MIHAQTALITGASRGIGAATAAALVRAGVRRLLLHYNTYKEGAEATLQVVRGAGASGALYQADLGTSEGIRSLTDALERDAPAPEILVNNAGSLVGRAKLLETTEELFDRTINLNVKSTWFVTKAVASSMMERKSGIVVNVSSIAGRTGGGIGAAIYAAAKGAITTMTKGMAKELAPHGIRVNAVSPGTVDNYFHEQFSTKQMLDSVVAMTPAGRLGTNEEVADSIVFLCSDESRYIHGQTIEINGGMYAP
jgi:3-oxoacyl-[acyl-carrier protein] reductase